MARTEKLRAARDQLKKEREEIINAAVESGSAIRVTVGVTSHGGSLENEKERKLAELKAAGEKRQIYFDEMVIETGVPRSREFFARSGVTADEAKEERIRVPEGQAIRAQGFPAQYRPPEVSDTPTGPRVTFAQQLNFRMKRVPRARLRKAPTK